VKRDPFLGKKSSPAGLVLHPNSWRDSRAAQL
jgi:hypothetical protein